MNKFFHRLFKVSLVNYIVVIVVVSLIFGSLHLFTKHQKTIFVDLIPYPSEYQQDPFPPPYTLTDSMSVGDAAYNWVGDKDAEITAIEKSDFEGYRKSILVTLRLNVLYDQRTRQYTYNDTPVIIGNKLVFNSDKTYFVGQINNIYQNANDRYRNFTSKEAVVKVNARKLEEWQAESLRNFEAKNSLGKVIAKTTDISISPAETDVETDKGVTYKGYSTIYKDVTVTLRLQNVYCSDQTCYFNGYIPLKIGAKFWVQSNNAFIDNGFIVDVTIY